MAGLQKSTRARSVVGLAVASAVAATLALVPRVADAAILSGVGGDWPSEQHRQDAINATSAATDRYNRYGSFNPLDFVYVFYDPGVATADGNFGNSDIRFGGLYPNERVVIHELAHVLGSGTTGEWYNNFNNGVWTGPRASQLVKQFDGQQAELRQSGVHFFPYGLNFDNEFSDLNAQRAVAVLYAMRGDMGFGPTQHPSAARVVNLTATDPFGASGFNEHYRWSDGYFAHAEADYRTGNFVMRTPASPDSFTFAGRSLTLNGAGRDTGLYFKGEGSAGVVTISRLVLDGGWVDHRANNPGDLFRLQGTVEVRSASVISATNGNIDVLANVSGKGDLRIPTTQFPGENNRYVRFFSGNNTFTGDLIVDGGRFELARNANFIFDVNAGESNAILGSDARAVLLNGVFQFDLADADPLSVEGWSLVSADNVRYGDSFRVNGFAEVNGVWSNGVYNFAEQTGRLTTLAAVPEPAGALGLAVGGLVLLRRRRVAM